MTSHLCHDGADVFLECRSLCEISLVLRDGLDLVLRNGTDENHEHALARHVDL